MTILSRQRSSAANTIAAKAPIRDLCPLDIALITETHFTKYFNVFIPIYTLFKSNHLDNTAHGGVAIIIKSTLSFSLLPNFSLDYLQSCPTYWPTSPRKKPEILDILISKVPSNLYCTPENILNINSDHSSVLRTINASPTICMTPLKLFYPSTDRIQFHNLVDQEITLNVKLKTHKDIDNAVDKFISIIQTAAWASQSKPNATSTKFPLLPIKLRSLITDKRRSRARYQSSRLPSHKAMYNKLSNSLKKHLLKHKLDIFQQKLSNLSSSDGSLWRETNKLLQYKFSLPPPTKTDNSIVITDEDKAETFRQHLSEIFKLHPDINNPDITSKVTQYLDCPMPLHLPE
ncbi:Uncharacterized protein FWK35_00029452 [Aphis craccivora]|uniref:Uncharacterized protein n=1 Tax=Aphis craccivora TaxID=307492 RepID=A0A6G0Y576_APHCR|nr:Uncharacterized protein FWK35_00029452 [Aphis craccivora]